MAYTMAVGDIVQATVTYFQTNVVQMMNTFHYRLIEPASLPDGAQALTQLLNSFFGNDTSTHWPNAWAGISSLTIAISEVRAQRIFPIRNVPVVIPRDITGIVQSEGAPGVIQYTIVEQGDFARQGGAGGLRVPGIPLAFLQDSLITPEFQTLAANLVSFAQTDKIVVGTPNVIWRPIIFNRTQPATSQDVTRATLKQEVRSQRTRVAFRGI